MNFAYRAYLTNGSKEAGSIEAASAGDAARQLAARGRTAFEIRPQREVATAKNRGHLVARGLRFSQSRLFHDLAILAEAGLTLPQALRATRAGEGSLAQRQVIDTIAASMAGGGSAATAFGQVEGISKETLALLASGERAAQMPAALRAIANRMIAAEARAAALRNALAYPAFLLLMMVAALGVIVFALVPSLAPIFENSGQPAPLSIRFLEGARLALTSASTQIGGLLALFGIAGLVSARGRRFLTPLAQRLVLTLPVIGPTLLKSNVARYLSSLSVLLGGGAPMTEALSLAAAANPLAQMRTSFLAVRDRVAAGDRLPLALEHTGKFDPRIVSLIAVGDEANRMPVVLDRASRILDDEVQANINRLLGLLTPAITIVLGLVIGGLVVSVMTALLTINNIAVQG